jgi:hypothetical protein
VELKLGVDVPKLGDGVVKLGDGVLKLGDGVLKLGDGVLKLGDGVLRSDDDEPGRGARLLLGTRGLPKLGVVLPKLGVVLPKLGIVLPKLGVVLPKLGAGPSVDPGVVLRPGVVVPEVWAKAATLERTPSAMAAARGRLFAASMLESPLV